MSQENDEWKAAIQSPDVFRTFMIDYFKTHKALTGAYDIPSYYEHYTVSLSRDQQIVIKLTTGMNHAASLPVKEKNKMTIEEFRTFILNKKFADQDMSLADVFQVVAGVPDSGNNDKH